MKELFSGHTSEFDAFAADYQAELARGLSVSGEAPSYFAKRRVEWSTQCLERIGVPVRDILDFGCGIGTTAPFFRLIPGFRSFRGVDTSPKSIEVANARHASDHTRFEILSDPVPEGVIDFAYCNGVFHHILPVDRAVAASYVHRALRPGGVFAFWENNPWNPATRFVMSRIPFDRNAQTLSPPVAAKLVRSVGFEVIRTDFLFIFPRILRWMRWSEPLVSRLPFGTQYQLLCRKPA